MNHFIYTKNDDVIKELQSKDCKKIKTLRDGTNVFILPPTFALNFDNKEDTWYSDILVF